MKIDLLIHHFATQEDDPRTTMVDRDPQNAAKEAYLFHKHEH